MKNNNIPKFDDFEVFIKSFEYNYPLKYSVVNYIVQWEYNLKYFQKEILDNLITLNKKGKAAYLKRLEFDCKEELGSLNTSVDQIDTWLKKYDTDFDEAIVPCSFSNNELNTILNSEVPHFDDTFEEGFNTDTEKIQYEFYNYFYGTFLNEALTFIAENIPNVSAVGLSSITDSPKLKTTLTVPQLAYFFKLLMDEKLLVFKHKTEVYNFIAANFSTKKLTSISADSIKNNMDKLQGKDIEVIKGNMLCMLQFIQKDKDKLGS